jgi:2-hydroxychromene-2-carboxylate isomerase
MSPPSPSIEFNFDISCPFAYIASTHISSLSTRTNVPITYRPVLLGAIYRATSAPQGAAGSASDVFNPTKRAVGQASMARTLKRYKVPYNPPAAHPMKSVDALRLLYCVHGQERRVLAEGLFAAYWVTGRDITSKMVLLDVARECGITGLNEASFSNPTARKDLEDATAQAIERGAFGVPGFWIPEARWVDVDGEERTGRYIWGQDRMHFVEATVLGMQAGTGWERVAGLRSLMPRCISTNLEPRPTKLEFWFDFSSPWAFLGWTQLPRLKRAFPQLEIVLKPFLLGILFREIGAPNMPMLAVSATKAAWSRQDHADWTNWWNAVNEQEGGKDRRIDFHWAEVFPIRTPMVLRVGIVEPKTMDLLCESLHSLEHIDANNDEPDSACWEKNENVSDEGALAEVLTKGGFDGAELVRKANAPEAKAKLRQLTAEAKELGICGVPTYRVLREDSAGVWKPVGGLIWGQDETNVVEDLIAGWDPENSDDVAEPRRGGEGDGRGTARL